MGRISVKEDLVAKPLLPDELWERIAPLLPEECPKPLGGRPRVSDRACLTGILFVLKTGTPWEYLPQEMSCGSGMTCWRRLRDWQECGLWARIWQFLLDELGHAGQLNLDVAVLDSCSVRAVFGGRTPARTRRIVAKQGRNVTC